MIKPLASLGARIVGGAISAVETAIAAAVGALALVWFLQEWGW